MKKILSLVIAVIIGALSVPFSAFATENGFKVYESVIVVSDDASATDAYAAQKLAHYLEKITGKTFGVVTDSTDSAEYEICVGETNRAKTDFSDSADGSYIINSSNKKILSISREEFFVLGISL